MNRENRTAFTLIEVLITLLIMAIVIPAIMRGLTLATLAAGQARHRTEASELADSQMSQILASESWQSGVQSGDFKPDWPAYTWKAAVGPWAGDTAGAGLVEIDLTVSWQDRNKEQSVTLCSLAYPRNQGSTSTSSSTSTQ